MGFDGAATFSGRKTGVQARLRKLAAHALFIHCRNHRLQLACVQAANQVRIIKWVYSNLTTLWKLFYYSPQKAEHMKDIQAVLNLPQLKMLKPTDTRWLSHENTIRSVKRSYTAIVVTFEAIYEESGDADTHGLSLLLKILETAAFIYMLSEVLAALQGFAKPCRQRVLISFNLLHWCLRLFRNCSVFKLLLWILHGSLKKCISDFTSSGIPLESFD